MSKEDKTAKLRKKFDELDLNNDGYLSSEELKLAMEQIGFEMDKDALEIMMKMADTNGDGKIDYKEFVENMEF